METKQKTVYEAPRTGAVFVQFENLLLEGSNLQGAIHNYVYEENAWEDEIW